MLVLSFDIGIKNLAYCLLDINKTQSTILDWNIIDCSEKVKKAAANSDTIKILITELDKLDYLTNVDLILIEKQPSCNPKMRIINSCIYMYFMIRSIDNNSKCKIVNYSPKHKLKCCNIQIRKTTKSQYSHNKKLAIEHTRFLIQDTPWIQFFNNQTKKDDLADCFLQAKSYFL